LPSAEFRSAPEHLQERKNLTHIEAELLKKFTLHSVYASFF